MNPARLLPAVLAAATSAFAQAQPPPSLVGCLGADGKLYDVRIAGLPTDAKCAGADLPVRLGSGTIERITPGPGLVGGGAAGDVSLGLDPRFVMPPDCPAGQIAVADGEGGWVCTPPSLLRPKNPVGKLWVLPRVEFCALPPERGGRPTLRFCDPYTEITVLNPGLNTARVSCLFFDANGSFIVWPGARSLTLGPGAKGRCLVPGAEDIGGAVSGSGVITSDWDVLLTASYERFDRDRSFQVESYPIDCSDPTGYEFVCQFATPE